MSRGEVGAGKPTGERGRPAAVTQTVDGGMGEKGETKEAAEGGRSKEARGLSVPGPENCASPLALLLFLPFKEAP